MFRRPPIFSRTDTLVPYPAVFRALALFAAAPVLAQTNVSTIEQSESNNRTTVEQAGVNASSYVNQSGVATAANPNKVDVSQKGNGAESFVAQTGAILNEIGRANV